MVKFGRIWKIETAEDYRTAIETLKDNEWYAMMGEGVDNFRREMAEIERQRADVTAQARARGII